ncbi:Hypothetical predicted protein [Mytilus galloprovincialis]|uniref:DUF4773 domain-containing protein n=1 Tax=Mytilus galloprovincialis TaxID=29158 RepID=A0A8B6C7E9_MYTGA|nr:Hypothetical predicted protein [Mytilus galloprovincialis]
MTSMTDLIFVFLLLSCHTFAFSVRELQTRLGQVQNERLLQQLNKRLIIHGGRNGECHVVGYNAGCCQHVELDEVDLNSTVCVNMTYLPTEYGISLTLTIDGRALINETVSAKNPPALCAELPYTKKIASLCLKFFNLDLSNSTFSGCVKIIIDLAYISIADYELGCFKIPPKGQRSKILTQNQWSGSMKKINLKPFPLDDINENPLLTFEKTNQIAIEKVKSMWIKDKVNKRFT